MHFIYLVTLIGCETIFFFTTKKKEYFFLCFAKCKNKRILLSFAVVLLFKCFYFFLYCTCISFVVLKIIWMFAVKNEKLWLKKNIVWDILRCSHLCFFLFANNLELLLIYLLFIFYFLSFYGLICLICSARAIVVFLFCFVFNCYSYFTVCCSW